MATRETTENSISVGNWLWSLILLSIPLVNLIMIIVWACGGTAFQSKKTFAQATIILWVIVILLAILATILIPLFGVEMQQTLEQIQAELQNQSAAH